MRPDNAIQESKNRRKKEHAALEELVSDIRSDPDATATEKKLASMLLASANTSE